MEGGVATTTSGDGSSSTSEDDVNNNPSKPVDGTTTYRLNHDVVLEVAAPEQWLCVSRMPLDMHASELSSLLEQFGPVKVIKTVHSQRSGKFKGYVVASFFDSSSGLQARHVLQGHSLRGHTLDCEWLRKTNCAGEESLHSKCLYVDQLPQHFRDMSQFRKHFSVVAKPPYCQIAMKNGVLQNWGLVEFDSSEEAELTLDRLNGSLLFGQPIRVQYCTPGVRAINIYMNFVNNPMDTFAEKRALLEEAPSAKVYDQLQSLSKQNPWFVRNLQQIMSSSSDDTVAKATITPLAPPPPDDPAQAALILLLARKAAAASPAAKTQTLDLLKTVVQEMEAGKTAEQVLKDLSDGEQNLPSVMAPPLMPVTTRPSPPDRKDPKLKDPKLSQLLLVSFQARLKQGIYSPNKYQPASHHQQSSRRDQAPQRQAVCLKKSQPQQQTAQVPNPQSPVDIAPSILPHNPLLIDPLIANSVFPVLPPLPPVFPAEAFSGFLPSPGPTMPMIPSIGDQFSWNAFTPQLPTERGSVPYAMSAPQPPGYLHYNQAHASSKAIKRKADEIFMQQLKQEAKKIKQSPVGMVEGFTQSPFL